MEYIKLLRYREETYRERILIYNADVEHMSGLIKARNEEIFAAEGRISVQELEEWRVNSAAIRQEIEGLYAAIADMEKDVGEMQREIAEIEAGIWTVSEFIIWLYRGVISLTELFQENDEHLKPPVVIPNPLSFGFWEPWTWLEA